MDKVIIAIDSFKGCMTSTEANAAAMCAFDDSYDYEATAYAVSDGGEGMLDAFARATGAKLVTVGTHDALMRRRDAQMAIDGDTAIIEVAQAVGLALIEPEQRNPLTATSYGVGELVTEAVRHCCHHLVIGLGGTATSDCGIGMLHALIDKLTHNGNIDDLHLDGIQVTLATDVDNPLIGANGAAAVFAPQKGATPEMVNMLERRAATFAKMSARHCGKDESATPGAGAAGGLGYAFLQFFDAKVESGADLLLHQLRFDDALDGCQIVITGEGSADRQTLMGKLPSKILEHARKAATPPKVWLLAGRIDDRDLLMNAGFTHVVSINQLLRDGENPMEKGVATRNMEATVRALLTKKHQE